MGLRDDAGDRATAKSAQFLSMEAGHLELVLLSRRWWDQLLLGAGPGLLFVRRGTSSEECLQIGLRFSEAHAGAGFLLLAVHGELLEKCQILLLLIVKHGNDKEFQIFEILMILA